MRFRLNENNLPLLATALVCVSLFVVASVRYEGFFSARNVADLFNEGAVVGVVAVGMTFVILGGGIDLSVGSVVALTSVVIAAAVERRGISPAVALPAALAVGALFGAGQGALIHFFRLPPFLVTLAGMFLARGLAFIISLESLSLAHAFFARAGEWEIALGQGAALRVTAVMFLATLAVALFVAHFTGFGRNVYAIGGSEQSAVLMGLPVGRSKVAVYALSGFCAALGGVITSLTVSGDPRGSIGLELDAIAAVVIGGTLLTGGVGYVFGTLLGVLIVGMIQTVIIFDGRLDTGWTRVAVGLLLFAFIALQRLVAWASGGAGWLTRRRHGFEVRGA